MQGRGKKKKKTDRPIHYDMIYSGELGSSLTSETKLGTN